MAETTKKFVVIEVNVQNGGEESYVREFSYPSAYFTNNIEKACFLPTYSKASTFAKKINKFYGYKKVKVLTIND